MDLGLCDRFNRQASPIPVCWATMHVSLVVVVVYFSGVCVGGDDDSTDGGNDVKSFMLVVPIFASFLTLCGDYRLNVLR